MISEAGREIVILSPKIYPPEIIQTAAFYISGVVQAEITEENKDHVVVELSPLDGAMPSRNMRRLFYRELTAATANLRAFAETADLRSIFARSAYYATEKAQNEFARLRQDAINQAVRPIEPYHL